MTHTDTDHDTSSPIHQPRLGSAERPQAPANKHEDDPASVASMTMMGAAEPARVGP